MDEASVAQNIHYGMLEQEAKLRLQLQIARAALSAATAYREHVVEPGWATSVAYLTGPTAIGLSLISVAPLGLLGAGTVFVGLVLASYGAAGSATYATQATSRTFGWFPGARDMGQQFDQVVPRLPEPKTGIAEDWVYDKLKDKMLAKELNGLNAVPKREIPGLPEKETTDQVIEFLKKEIERLSKEIDEIDRQINRELDHIQQRDNESPGRPRPPPERVPILHKADNDHIPLGPPVGGAYAGGDEIDPTSAIV
ncbi:hypothetical protein [Burkholderia sp. Ac-20365]|uniref:hypothetical protein n=1 Tax=Burkholderia sp. Ac-20365 TaxID=2703897 RepID=UPI00197BD693|nr:hypothetical protein [Burkholderia sp. Ac-20365]MBN3761118.1 hypothetical protein [Burkholderia sp. Ac-20365]